MHRRHLLSALAALAAAGTLPGPAAAQGPASGQPAEPIDPRLAGGAAEPEDEGYRLGPGDRLHVITFGEESLTGDFYVSDRGDVALPLVGAIRAQGLTVPEFTQAVVKALAAGYLRNPRVAIQVMNYRPYYILGEVAKPGQYPYVSGLTVENAVATAGGFTYRANHHKVVIKGARDDKEHAVKLTSSTLVHPGDTIRILERFF